MSAPGVPGVMALGDDINKNNNNQQDETKEGVAGTKFPELNPGMDDAQLLALSDEWQKSSSDYQGKMQKRWELNEKYWLGMERDYRDISVDERPQPDNLIFESTETLLPIATRQNPEPVVDADNTPLGESLAHKTEKMLIYLSKRTKMKLTLKDITRNWMIYFQGVGKVGWSVTENEISFISLRPQVLILDKNATIVNGEYTGEFIGEVRKDRASVLIKRFPDKEAIIMAECQGKTGTELKYTEWWTDEYVFWRLNRQILGASKNPHFETEPTMRMRTDEFGQQTPEVIPPYNHFNIPKKPYIFLSVFNLGLHPHDDTNLIHQNIRTQDLITKRLKQIDVNADNTNGGSVVSGDFFTKEQAAQVGEAKRNGDTVWVPSGDVNKAYRTDTGAPLPAFVYQSLLDYRNELRGNFGVAGSLPSGTQQEKTVRGKIIQRDQDTSRIGGGITEYIENFSERVFDWFIQLMCVYYDEPHVATIIGPDRAKEFISLSKEELAQTELTVTVKEGSLIPKDPLVERNEAIDLYAQGAMDPLTLFEKLDYPNPQEMVRRLILWKSNPMALAEGGAAAATMPMPVQGQPNTPAEAQAPQVEQQFDQLGQQANSPPQ